MSYQVLARKWRPRRFDEMVGQGHILRALINALDNDRLHHAYLFTGTRGVGKTTIARILAKSLNCEKGVSATPCGECSSCVEVDEGRFVDLIEVDAASRTKVDETRELLDNVQYAPTRGRYKVYLIDEVHMFSNHSFNALLKTLEEPPPHVKFLLATTDPQKLPVTILSRCLQFNLKALQLDPIRDHLEDILSKESINAEKPALNQIARAAHGSMRDALSLLDQAIAYGGGVVNDDDVCTMLGVIGPQYTVDVVDAIAAGDASQALNCVQAMSEQAVDYEMMLSDVLSLLQRVAVEQAVPNSTDNSRDDKEAVIRLASQMSAEDVQLFYQIGLIGRRDIRLAPDLRAGFEMVLLRMLAFTPNGATQTPSVAQKKTPSVAPAVKPASASVTTPKAQPVKPVVTETAPQQAAEIAPDVSPLVSDSAPVKKAADINSSWSEITEAISLSGLEMLLASQCTVINKSKTAFTLLLGNEHKQLHREKFEQRIEKALQSVFGDELKLEIQIGVQENETPAMQVDREKQELQEHVETEVANDDVVQSIQQRFGATVQGVKPTEQ